MRSMFYKILETDESIEDLLQLSFNAYLYTRSKSSGERVFNAFEKAVADISVFPLGFRGISIEHRGYEIRIFSFSNYNLFFIIDEENLEITILRVLYQKQDWASILRMKAFYHVEGKAV